MKKLLSVLLTFVLLIPFQVSGKGSSKPRPVVEKGHLTYCQYYDMVGNYYVEFVDMYGYRWFYSNVESIDDMDQKTLSKWTQVQNYQVTRDENGLPDSGWIMIHSLGQGYWFNDGAVVYNTLMVHKSDPRYNGDQTLPSPEDWEFQVMTYSGQGNMLHDVIWLTTAALQDSKLSK